MSIVYLGLGSNLGERGKNIQRALSALEDIKISILKKSTIIETNPAGGPPQDKFLNSVIKCRTSLSPQELLSSLKLIEKTLGRVKTVINGPRIIDIDILLFDDLKIESDELTIPHPRMFERDFVMIPLKEIEPSFNG